MRMYIELRRDVVPQVMLNQLYKRTELQKTFGVNMLAIVGGHPRILNLKEVLMYFLDFRRDVVTRRCIFELRDRKSTRLNSSHVAISYAVFCLKKKKYSTPY